MKKKLHPFSFIFTLIIFLTSCQEKIKNRAKKFEEKDLDGIYLARLAPINPGISKYLNGSLTLRKNQKHLIASVRFSQGPHNGIHEQSLYYGKRCPRIEDDMNGDQLIDSRELETIIREKLIPLDDDLSSQRMGSGIFPKSDEYGSYQWTRNTLFELLIKDLKDEDLNLKDNLVKLNQRDEFNFEHLIVIISGISLDTYLPETASNKNDPNGNLTFPVACGVIRKISKSPGILDKDSSQVDETNENPTDDGFDFPELEDEDDINYGDVNESLLDL